MSRRGLCLLVLLSLLAPLVLGQHQQPPQLEPELRAFLQRLKAAYAELEDLQAIVTILQITPEGKERETRVRIKTLVKQRILRLEILDPPEIRDQVYTLEGRLLSQYIPVSKVIIIQELTEQHALYTYLEWLNFDLEEIIARLQEEGFSLTLSQQITSPALPLELQLGITIAGLAAGQLHPPSLLSLSLREPPGVEDFPLALRVSAWQLGDYLLEATSSQKGLASKEWIWIDPVNLVPRRVEARLTREVGGKLKEEGLILLVREIHLNRGLTAGELLALPKDAQIIRYPVK
jgi:outer membrane lipoprotein-sorting protein